MIEPISHRLAPSRKVSRGFSDKKSRSARSYVEIGIGKSALTASTQEAVQLMRFRGRLLDRAGRCRRLAKSTGGRCFCRVLLCKVAVVPQSAVELRPSAPPPSARRSAGRLRGRTPSRCGRRACPRSEANQPKRVPLLEQVPGLAQHRELVEVGPQRARRAVVSPRPPCRPASPE